MQKRPMNVGQGQGCKIKIKNTPSGKTIEFHGNCTKEQLSMAKMNLNDSDSSDDDEE